MWYAGGYKINYVEEKIRKNGVWTEYVKFITIYKDDEIVLCSKDKTEEEFINYLKFVTNDEVIDVVKQLLEKGRTEEDEVMDFVAECQAHDYLWWGNGEELLDEWDFEECDD